MIKRLATIAKTLLIIFLIIGWLFFNWQQIWQNPSLAIQNIHSYPNTGDNWTVFFETKGKADLTITPNNQVTIDDLDFFSLKCGDKERKPQLSEKGVIFYPSWKCKDTSELVHLVNKKGNHDFRFAFGKQIIHAFNAGWYDDSWNYRTKITVQNGQVLADITGFPIYVNLANLPADFHSHVKEDASDIRVTTTDGVTEVPREVVYYASSTDTGELHFKGDILDASNVDFYIYYGNPSATDLATTTTYGRNNVWTNGYGGVWHMGTSTLVDSTGNAGNSTTNTGVATTSSKIGLATDYTPNQNSIIPSSVNIGNNATSTLTYTAWVNGDSWNRAMEKSNQYFLLNMAGSCGPLLKIKGTNQVASVGTLDTRVWYQVGGRYSYSGGSTGVLNAIVNGSIVATTSNLTAGIDQQTTSLYLGSDDSGAYFNGRIDELRIANVVRTNTWLVTEYNNLNSPSTFYATSTEETKPVVSVSISPSSFNYGSINNNTSSSTLTLWGGAGIIATNGAVAADFDIYGATSTGSGGGWTLATNNTGNNYMHQFCKDTDVDCTTPPTGYTGNELTTSPQELKHGVAQSGTYVFQLQITTPTTPTDVSVQSAIVTIQATAP
ncbi:MAG: hypothetical protein NTW06_04885 [Candidatus Falkowbacteria bacterium]|nr:hypothetical protein [Candidatus Falkowbacteria bacterium]